MTGKQRARAASGWIWLVLIGVAAVLTGLWLGQHLFGAQTNPNTVVAKLQAATLLPEPKPLKEFSLTGQDGQVLDRKSLIGHWTFVAFGYTHCPDVCPTLMATFSALDKALSKSSTDAKPEFLFISVDPERDTPEQLRKFVRFFDARIQGATAAPEVLRPLAAQLGIMYQRSDAQESATGYLVDHSASILLLDQEVRLSAIFGYPQDPLAMAEDFRAISELR